jgi:hypothetical protein
MSANDSQRTPRMENSSINYDPETPDEYQINDWSDTVRVTYWMLRSIGLNDLAYDELVDIMVPSYVTTSLGLLDGSGASIAELLRTRFGLHAASQRRISWEELLALVGSRPIAIGSPYHWVAIRETLPNGSLRLMNPAPGFMSVQQELTPSDFGRLGPFAAIWIED